MAERTSRTPRSIVSLAELKAGLQSNIRGLVRELLPGGVVAGQEWQCGSVAGERGDSMAVHLEGVKAGVWADFSTGEVGDVFDLVSACLFSGDLKRAVPWARQWLGLDAGTDQPAPIRRPTPPPKTAGAGDDESAARRGAAIRMWLGSQESLLGTPVEVYLKGRGIDLVRLGRQPRCLRFSPMQGNVESGQSWPCLMAQVVGVVDDAKGSLGPVAVHRTWLQVHPDGRVTKAPLSKPKKVLGRSAGGFIPLWRGASGLSLRDAPPDDVVVIAEGIEDGFSVAVCRPEYRVLVGLNLSNIGNVWLPPQVRRVYLAGQNDTAAGALKGLEKMLERLWARGLEVMITRPPPEYKDFNDMLQGARRRD